jgi:hypothetical protein
MRPIPFVAVLALVLTNVGCYHSTVDAGLVPSGRTVERPWAHSFIGGLIPPSTVETASRCPNGIARVDTQLSFLNMLVGGLTGGIYTPMSITVRCATAGTAMGEAIESTGDAADAMTRAVDLSRATGEPVFVQF